MTAPQGQRRADLEATLQDVVAAHLEVEPDTLVPEAHLREDLGLDSLGAIELAMALEDEFDIALPEEVVAEVRTYGDVVELVTERIAVRMGDHGDQRVSNRGSPPAVH